jgi:ParB-like chromosome segregation protein Spo0J
MAELEMKQLPLGRAEARHYSLNQQSFLVDPTSLRPHPQVKQYTVPMPQQAYERLKESIQKFGVRVPLHITPEGVVLDGYHRLKVSKELRLTSVPVQVLDLKGDEQLIWMIRANLDRRQLTAGQRAMLARMLFEIEKAKAKKRQEATRAKPGEKVGRAKAKESFPGPRATEEKGQARDLAAKQAGVSGRTLEKAAKAVEKKPELEEKLKRGEISVDEAYKLAKAEEKPKPSLDTDKGIKSIRVRLTPELYSQLKEWARRDRMSLDLKAASLISAACLKREDPTYEAASDSKEPQICFRLPIERYQLLEELAGDRGLSLSKFVSRIVTGFLNHREELAEIF